MPEELWIPHRSARLPGAGVGRRRLRPGCRTSWPRPNRAAASSAGGSKIAPGAAFAAVLLMFQFGCAPTSVRATETVAGFGGGTVAATEAATDGLKTASWTHLRCRRGWARATFPWSEPGCPCQPAGHAKSCPKFRLHPGRDGGLWTPKCSAISFWVAQPRTGSREVDDVLHGELGVGPLALQVPTHASRSKAASGTYMPFPTACRTWRRAQRRLHLPQENTTLLVSRGPPRHVDDGAAAAVDRLAVLAVFPRS